MSIVQIQQHHLSHTPLQIVSPMVSPLCLTTPRCSPRARTIPAVAPGHHHTNPNHIIRVNYVFQEGPPVSDNKYSYSFVTAKASKDNDRNTKPNSVICSDCDGNGAVLCSQCKGSGVNSVDIFDGQFKAGDSCWLCGGRKEMLCGNCNGAGFVGGFLSTYDE